jgi:hypothetical protein
MRATNWNTYAVLGYTYQAGTDPRACGGVHLHQVRRVAASWKTRVVDSNGRHTSAGPAKPIPDDDGEAKFAAAKSR